MISTVVSEIRALLEPLGTAERAQGEKKYLKSDLEFLGVKVPEVRRQAKGWLAQRSEFERDELLSIADKLWTSSVHELRTFGIEILTFRLRLLESADIDLLERMLHKANTWAHVDAIAVHIVGALVERDRSLLATTDEWSSDQNFWLRRSAMLALLPGLRKGGGGVGPLRSLCRLDDRGDGVLHPQGDRMDSARDVEEAPRPGRWLCGGPR